MYLGLEVYERLFNAIWNTLGIFQLPRLCT